MKLIFYTVPILLLLLSQKGSAQSRPLSLGITTDIQMESPIYIYYGIQGKYGLNRKNAIQAQLGLSNNNIGFIGADYIYKLFEFKKSAHVWLGMGTAFEFLTEGSGSNMTLNAQAGFGFNIGSISPYVGYKPKFYFDHESFDTSNFTLGLRYRL